MYDRKGFMLAPSDNDIKKWRYIGDNYMYNL
jgi:hypothetical protein